MRCVVRGIPCPWVDLMWVVLHGARGGCGVHGQCRRVLQGVRRPGGLRGGECGARRAACASLVWYRCWNHCSRPLKGQR